MQLLSILRRFHISSDWRSCWRLFHNWRRRRLRLRWLLLLLPELLSNRMLVIGRRCQLIPRRSGITLRANVHCTLIFVHISLVFLFATLTLPIIFPFNIKYANNLLIARNQDTKCCHNLIYRISEPIGVSRATKLNFLLHKRRFVLFATRT